MTSIPSKFDSMSRRGFMKLAGLAGLTLAASSGLVGCDTAHASTGFKAPGVKTDGYQYAGEIDEGEWYHGACQRNCFDTCMMKIRVKDGRVVEVRGDENSPYTAGGLCVKTQSYVDWCYHED